MGKSTPKPTEIDIKLCPAILKGLAEDIERGLFQVVAFEKINYSGATTVVINFKETGK